MDDLDVWTCGAYEGPLQRAILRFKGDYRSSLGRGLGALLARLPFPEDVTLAVPVPSPRSRMRWRGYNPVAVLTQQLPLPVCEALACAEGAVTKALGAEARREAQGRFTPVQAVAGHVLLVDDVVTTGSTVLECAQVLRAAGASRVSVAALARTERRSPAEVHRRGR